MDSSENKNLIIALVLMLAVWLGFSFFFPASRQEAVTQPASPAPVVVTTPTESLVTSSGLTASVDNAEPGSSVVNVDLPKREIVVETDKYEAVFTTSGARLLSFKLKDYRSTADDDSPPVQLFEPGPLQYATLRTTGTEGFPLAEDTLFDVSIEDKVFISGGEQREIHFHRTFAGGLEIVKSFVLRGDAYTIETSLLLRNASPSALRGSVGFSLVQRWNDSLQPDSYTFAGPATLVGDDLDEVDVDDLKDGTVSYAQNIAWTSFQTKYFLSVVVPRDKAAERVQVLRKGESIENIVESPSFVLQPGESRQLSYLVFIGPKDFELLKSAGSQLDKVIHFGFFDILAKPLFFVLTFFFGYIKNYGVAIILLTVVIKLCFWPLTHKSYSSMKSMQKLQPEMQKLREKFKSDKERLNKELMELYKNHKVNPLGGCLPMLVQIPVFFALYKVLLDSIALRHAPFALWLTDLSAKDPYYITPILMGASMFVQQKMTPMSIDPIQAKIFMFMPIVFTFMFLNFPSGLVIYWLVNNLLTILQQYFIHRKPAGA